jgi:hypothetical protein
VKAAAVALLSLGLAGCAPAARTVQPRVPAPPVSQWEDGADDDPEAPTALAPEDSAIEHLAEAGTSIIQGQTEQAEQTGQSAQEANRTAPFNGLEPEVVHRARIEMARAELVEQNQNKERVDLAEELQRELAALRASSQTSKSRARHGGPTTKQP